MELKTNLNSAHQLVRVAERQINQGKHSQAIQTEKEVVRLLRLALEDCQDNKIAESINLQIEFHIKQQQIIKIKEISYSKYTKNLENLQRRMQKASLQEADALQGSIYRAFEETESLLAHLRQGTGEEEEGKTSPAGAKMPKDDKVIIEELQTANNHLRNMVETMFSELETCRSENTELKNRIRDLEREKSLRSVVDAPISILLEEKVGEIPTYKPSELPVYEPQELPPLAPLELPTFDFSVHQNQ